MYTSHTSFERRGNLLLVAVCLLVGLSSAFVHQAELGLTFILIAGLAGLACRFLGLAERKTAHSALKPALKLALLLVVAVPSVALLALMMKAGS